jgi:hypothetical protein
MIGRVLICQSSGVLRSDRAVDWSMVMRSPIRSAAMPL